MNKENSTLREIKIEESNAELSFNFDPSAYSISKEAAIDAIRVIAITGGLQGFCVENTEAGEISIFFDPDFHTSFSRDIALEQMLSAIRDSAVF